MMSKSDFGPTDRVSRRRWYWPIRSIGSLMLVVALSGLMLRAWRSPSRRPGPTAGVVVPIPARPVPGPIPNPWAGVAPPVDRFVVTAPAEIDPAIVVQAREDLDVEMVVNPETWRRGSPSTGPARAVSPDSPGPVPAPAPVEPWRRR